MVREMLVRQTSSKGDFGKENVGIREISARQMSG